LRWQEPNANNVYFNEKNSGIKHLIYNIVMAKKKNYSIDVMIIIMKRAQRKTPLVFFPMISKDIHAETKKHVALCRPMHENL
jgi:hypothetical protein